MRILLSEALNLWRSPLARSRGNPYRLELDLTSASLETTAALIATHAIDAQEVLVVDECPIALIDYAQLQIIQAQLAALSRSLATTQKLQGQVTALEQLIEGSLRQPFQEAFESLFDGSREAATVEFFYPAESDIDPWLIVGRGLTLLRGRAIAQGDERRAGQIDAIVVSVNSLATQLTQAPE
jgi:hypothetical protein